MGDEQLHRNYRSILNTNVPATRAQAVSPEFGFVKQSFWANLFHNPFQNTKYLSPDGHMEAVFDRKGNLVRSDDYKGTFNFYSPSQAADHKAADVDPFFKWGN
jgi:hypothetical protein